MRRTAMDAGYFDALYASDGDPWKFATSEYERAKYEATLAALPKARYASALEIGCSIGVFTRMLADRCDRLVAIDPVERALQQARARCTDWSGVAFQRMEVPGAWPDETFDLILLAEVVYYLTREQIADLSERVKSSLHPGGQVVLVHWTDPTDYPLSGDDAAQAFIKASRGFLAVVQQQRMSQYRLDILQRSD